MKKPAYKAKSGPTSSDKEKPKEKPKAKPAEDEDEKPKAKAKPKPRDDDEEDERPKKKPAAKAADDDEEEEKPRKKPAAKAADDDEEDERPKKKPAAKAAAKPAKKQEALSLDDDEGEDDGDSSRDGKIADGLQIDSGFKNKRLMKQVEAELSSSEVLHWAARPSMFLAQRKAGWVRIGGIVFAVIGAIAVTIVLVMSSKMGIPWFASLIPGIFVLVGILIMTLGPKAIIKQAANGWYAVTDRRAIVYAPSLFGSGGHATTYEPSELRRMRVEKSRALEGGGSLIFKTIITKTTRTETDSRGRSRTSTSTNTTHYGFLDIENVVEVETLVHKVLLGADDDDDDDDDDD
jgi:hypothetical protein